ncbi:MAG: hypothetical protein R6V12_04735 [Candidatus Hydrogenedentota bacterium]
MNKSLQHAEVQLFQASMAEGPERKALLAEAKDALIRAETIEKGCASWRLACLNALEGRAELCRRWLERAHTHGTLPERGTLESEPSLSSMRNQKWFKRFLNDIQP